MADLLDAFPPSLDDMLGCAKRELKLRRQVYPHRIFTKKMKQETADREIAIMAAIVDYLDAQRRVAPPPRRS